MLTVFLVNIYKVPGLCAYIFTVYLRVYMLTNLRVAGIGAMFGACPLEVILLWVNVFASLPRVVRTGPCSITHSILSLLDTWLDVNYRCV